MTGVSSDRGHKELILELNNCFSYSMNTLDQIFLTLRNVFYSIIELLDNLILFPLNNSSVITDEPEGII